MASTPSPTRDRGHRVENGQPSTDRIRRVRKTVARTPDYRHTIRLIAPDLDAAVEVALIDAMEVDDAVHVQATPGAGDLLAGMPSDSWAVVTSGSANVATARMRAAGLLMPPVLITADDVTAGKPHPECYLAASQRVGVPARDCVAVEDAPAGIEAAHAAVCASSRSRRPIPPSSCRLHGSCRTRERFVSTPEQSDPPRIDSSSASSRRSRRQRPPKRAEQGQRPSADRQQPRADVGTALPAQPTRPTRAALTSGHLYFRALHTTQSQRCRFRVSRAASMTPSGRAPSAAKVPKPILAP